MLKDLVDSRPLPTATSSHEYQKQRSAEGGSAIDARSSEVGYAIAIL